MKPNPISQLIQVVWDLKAWLKHTQGEMENHSKYHVFRFTKDSSSKVSELLSILLVSVIYVCLNISRLKCIIGTIHPILGYQKV